MKRLFQAFIFVACAASASPPPDHAAGGQAREIPTVREIRSLTPGQASETRPVHLRGIVTALPAYRSSFFLMDATGGISIDRDSDEPAVKPGDRVEIRGASTAGLFAPAVHAIAVTVFGQGKLPPAKLMQLYDLAGGRQDSQWLSLRGMVRAATVESKWRHPTLVLDVDIGAGNLIVVHIHDFAGAEWQRLPGATVRMRGVCGTIFGDHRDFVGLRLFVYSLADLDVERPAPADPFDLPLRPIGNLLQFGDNQGLIQRVKVRGAVTYIDPGQGFFLQSGQRGVFVKTSQSTPAVLGSELEVVGYPTSGGYSPILDNADFRIVGSRPPTVPLPAAAAGMIGINRYGFSAAPFDTLLVRLQGQLVEEISSPSEDRLILRDGDLVFPARLAKYERFHRALVAGTLMQITGVCVAQAGESHEPHSFEILLRSPADIEVLQNVPWWKTRRAGWVVALVLIVLFAVALVWFFLRRHAELRALAMTDPLTGLYNRRAFYLLAEQQWQLTLRRKSALLLFYADLDRFKEINDTLGHKEGDRALQTLAEVLRECFRGTDIIARMGGDEFAVLFDAGTESRSLIGQRLDAAIERANRREGRRCQLSLSVGVLVCDASLSDFSMAELVTRADALMYHQKKERRKVAV